MAFAQPQVDAVSRTTDARGTFSFRSFPRSASYMLYAVCADGYRRLRMSRAQATGVPLRVQLGPFYYERLGFVDEAGEPVDISSIYLPLGRGQTLFGSNQAAPHMSLTRWFDATGHRLAWATNEVIYLYPESAPNASQPNRSELPVRTIRPPGYAAVAVPENRTPVQKWPRPTGQIVLKSTRVVDARMYQCLLPTDSSRPAWWGPRSLARPFSLTVGIGPEDQEQWYMPMPGRDTFWGPSHDRIDVRFNQTVKLRFERREEDGVVVLIPKMSRLGYLSVRYANGRADRPGVGAVPYLYLASGQLMDGVIMWPGYIRYGPMPVGRYSLAIRWADTARPIRDEISIDLKPGWQRVDAR